MSTATLPATATDAAPVADTRADRIPRESDLVHSRAARASLALLRLATGWIFLWAFLDKTFGLGFSTPIDRAWINGGTPSQGFLLGDSVVGLSSRSSRRSRARHPTFSSWPGCSASAPR